MVSPSDGEIQELPIADPAPGPQDEALRNDLSAELHAALNELPPLYRDAIFFCDVEGLAYSEIADRQSTTIGTIRSRIHRGRKLLRDIIQRRGIYQD
jgi:RNA polymerase sigma-70 factor (ECF subfamily)